MKPRLQICVTVSIVALLTFLFLLHLKKRTETASEKGKLPSLGNTPTQEARLSPPPSITSNQAQVSVNAQSMTVTSRVTSSQQSALIRQAIEEQNVPLDFYGRVTDQETNSLAGAKVKMRVRHWDASSYGSSIPIEKETDADGRFDVHGVTGDAFDVEGITKAGYELEPTRRGHPAKEGSYSQPVLFRMWSTNVHESIISGQKSFHIEPDGRPYVIDLTSGTLQEGGDGDLRVWIKYVTESTPTQNVNWSSEIDLINGGLLQETNGGSSMYLAPDGDYEPLFRFDQAIRPGQRGSTGENRFFLRLKDGKEYGRISIELFAPYNDKVPGLIRIGYVINPSGSRILR